MARKQLNEIAEDYTDWESAFTTVNDRIAKLEAAREKHIQQLRLDLAEDVEKKLLQVGKKNEKELAEWKEKVAKKAANDEKNRQKQTAQELANWDKKQIVEQYNFERQLARENADLEKQYREATRSNKLTNFLNSIGASKLTGSDANTSLVTDKITSALDKLSSSLDNAIDSAMETYSKYQGSINARLVGSDKTFKSLMDGNSKSSPFYKTSDYISSLNDLVSQGISYNVEQRAFIQTMKDKIVTTFDATNGTLLRLVRLQNSDSTAARMGMEAMLTEYLNSMYMNTEYLSTMYDNVSSSLVEAESLLGTQGSAELEYVVQKWLGSMSSVGLSDSAVSSIANALGYLGSGDVNSLVGTDVGNLMAMAISRSGLSYADVLKNGLTTDSTDQIMSALVEYLQYIGNSSNNVVLNQLAGLFGMTVSDIQSAKNIDVSSIIGNNLSYEGGLSKLASRLSSDFSTSAIMSGNGAVTIAEAYDNVLQNALFSLGSSIADNGYQYGLYKITDTISDLTSGAVGTVGKVINKVANIAKIGVLASGGIENLYDVLSGASVMGFNILDLFNSFGDATMGSARSGSTSSARAVVNSDGSISVTSGTTSVETAKITAQEDTEKQKQLDEAPLDIKNYLINTFDKKMDTLITMTAGGANYSVLGVDTSKFIGMIGSDSVVVSSDSTSDNIISTISEGVDSINSILKRVVSGEVSFHVKSDSTPTYSASNVVNAVNTMYANTLTRVIGG